MALPIEFITRTRALLGEEYDKLEAALQADVPVSIRINRNKGTKAPSTPQVGWSETGYYLPERLSFTFDPLFHAGAYYVQEASSMFLEQAIRNFVTEPVRCLDLCAAPGGKSTHLLSTLPEGSLLVSNEVIRDIYANLDFFKDKILLRPQEISNNPEVARRLGLVAINTALEADIFGNINSTHVSGTRMMNGIGGSGDFTRSAMLSIFTTPSTAKEGKISAFVPMVSHLDHSEHSVKVIITEYGVADLRGKSPIQRARCIIDNCVHPDYKPLLEEYLAMGIKGHTPQNLKCCFAFHEELAASGDMHNVDWSKYNK